MSTWTASVYTVVGIHVTMFACVSACVYIVHVVKTSIRIAIWLKLDVVVSNVRRSWSGRVKLITFA